MAKNRKNRPAAVRFGPALKAMLICLAIGGAGIGYVGLKKQIHDLSRQIEQKEKAVKALREENAKLGRQLATLQSPPFLHRRANDLQLSLRPPEPAQIVRLPEPVAPPPPGETAVELAYRMRMAAHRNADGDPPR